jgi:methylglutaconyl-CoA hydratase
MEPKVLYQIEQRIAYITLNRPEKRNALSPDLIESLTQTFLQAEQDSRVKVVVLKANGDVFCAGADLEYIQKMQHFSLEENLQDSNQLMALFQCIYKLKKVVIAQVHGHAIAGGCGLVTVCDFAFATDTANFGYSEVKIGFVPAMVLNFLVKKIGEAKTKEMLLTGQFISAEEAERWGLINKYFDNEQRLHEAVFQFAQKLCTNNSAASMQMIKELMADYQGKSLDENIEKASRMNAQARATDDCKKGIHAFLTKQKLEW